MLKVEHLGKTYGEGDDAVEAIGDLEFEVRENEFVCIVGPSGCGKTTLLKCMSGLLTPTRGEIRLHDQRVDGPPERMALVFQPDILLMDEPFASVDAQTRADLEDLILEVRRQYGVTVVFVTHDIDESVYLGDRIIVLTPVPTKVQETLDVDLPSPRDQLDTKEQPEFARLRAHVYRSIKRKQTSAEPERTPEEQPATTRS